MRLDKGTVSIQNCFINWNYLLNYLFLLNEDKEDVDICIEDIVRNDRYGRCLKVNNKSFAQYGRFSN